MKSLTIGVLAVQGAVREHAVAMERVLAKRKIKGSVRLIKKQDDFPLKSNDLNYIDALVIPGGESTTISRNLIKSGLFELISTRVQEHSLPIFGTCAGCILLAKKLVEPKEIQTFNAMDIEVRRNAFGRQKDSFEANLTFDELKDAFNAVFIRGPLITKAWDKAQILAKFNNQIVAVRQNEFLALSFHPELTVDTRIHEYFLEMILSSTNK